MLVHVSEPSVELPRGSPVHTPLNYWFCNLCHYLIFNNLLIFKYLGVLLFTYLIVHWTPFLSCVLLFRVPNFIIDIHLDAFPDMSIRK